MFFSIRGICISACRPHMFETAVQICSMIVLSDAWKQKQLGLVTGKISIGQDCSWKQKIVRYSYQNKQKVEFAPGFNPKILFMVLFAVHIYLVCKPVSIEKLPKSFFALSQVQEKGCYFFVRDKKADCAVSIYSEI